MVDSLSATMQFTYFPISQRCGSLTVNVVSSYNTFPCLFTFFLTYISYVSNFHKLTCHLQWGTYTFLAGGKISKLHCCLWFFCRYFVSVVCPIPQRSLGDGPLRSRGEGIEYMDINAENPIYRNQVLKLGFHNDFDLPYRHPSNLPCALLGFQAFVISGLKSSSHLFDIKLGNSRWIRSDAFFLPLRGQSSLRGDSLRPRHFRSSAAPNGYTSIP